LTEKPKGLIFPNNGFSSINMSEKRIKCALHYIIVILYSNYGYYQVFINIYKSYNINVVVICLTLFYDGYNDTMSLERVVLL
jgi:hypothetical protein